jgi:hypothetical protein
MKVYCWTGFTPTGFAAHRRNCKFFMAATTKAEVYRATGKKAHDFYAVSESGNEHDARVALAEPGVVFFWDHENHVPRDNHPRRVDGDGNLICDPDCVLGRGHDGDCMDDPPLSDPRPDPREHPEFWTE